MTDQREIAAQLARIKDAAKVGEAFATRYLPRLRALSDAAQSEADALPFFVAAGKEAQQAASLLDNDRQRGILERLCNHHRHRELARISARAAARNRAEWDRAAEALVQSQLDEAKRWPLDDGHFTACVGNGLAAIETHHAQMGIASRHTETRQARFLSDLLTARLEAVAPVNIALAQRLYRDHADWIAPERRESLGSFMTGMERIARSAVLADCIVTLGPRQDWLGKVAAVAGGEKDGDAEFEDLLRHAVQARVDDAERAERNQTRAERNALLDRVLTHAATSLHRLLADHPELAPAWNRATPETRTGLMELMRLNRMDRQPEPDDRAKRLFALALGHALRGHPAFDATNLAAAHWNIAPKYQRLALLELQENRRDAENRQNAVLLKRLTRNKAATYSARGLRIFA